MRLRLRGIRASRFRGTRGLAGANVARNETVRLGRGRRVPAVKTKQTILSDTTLVCTVCGETAAILWRVGVDHLLGGAHRYRAVQCLRCGTRRLDPRPD